MAETPLVNLTVDTLPSLNGHARRAHPSALRPLTVMQITWSFVAGGSEMFAFKIAAGLDRRRFRSVMCAVDKGGALEPEIERLGIPFHVLHRRRGLDPRLFWRIGKLCRKHRVDVVHTHHFNQLLYAAPAAKLLGLRLIHTEHSVEWLDQLRPRLAFRNLARLCHRVLAVGADVANALHERAGIARSQIEIIRAGVDSALFQADRSAARRRLELTDPDRIATIVARLSPEKNHANLLSAFAEVVKRLPNARLLIVGDGVEEASLRALIHKLDLEARVKLLGVRRDIPEILAATDVFVLSSDREGLPIAVLEAMAAGRPVVCTTVGDLPLVVQDGVTGSLVPPQNPSAFSVALTELLADPLRAADLGTNARKFVSREYSQQRMIERHAEVYVA